jgi:dTDP-4-dehydrorhamnose 3,5-epimerase
MSSARLSVISDSASSIGKVTNEAGNIRPTRPTAIVMSTALPEVVVIEPKIHGDQRGFFFEAFQAERYASYGITQPFVQDNISRSNPMCQGKLLTVLRGSVLDVAVDVRLGSPTFGRYASAGLNEENRRQIWIPRGFAHGFLVLSESADIFYKCDELYSPADEIALRWNDPAFGIKWGIESPSLSGRDAAAPFLAAAKGLPTYGKC